MTEPIDSETDGRIPVELVLQAQIEAYVQAFNGLILRGVPEDDALEEAFAAAITPEQRAAAVGDEGLQLPE